MNETDNQYIERVNSLSDDELTKLIESNSCPYEPQRDGKSPIGMYHCPLCGEMVLSGKKHPPKF